MARLCERPGCSEPGAAAYGMIPEDLLFWIAPLRDAPVDDHNVLCRRHADAMVVPRGWTLDDRREPIPRLFMPRRPAPAEEPARAPRRRPRPAAPPAAGEQLQIDGTGEIARPVVTEPSPSPPPAPPSPAPSPPAPPASSPPASSAPSSGASPPDDPSEPDQPEPYSPWQPEFDHDDDLDGLLEVRSPLLARAFRGTGRARS